MIKYYIIFIYKYFILFKEYQNFNLIQLISIIIGTNTCVYIYKYKYFFFLKKKKKLDKKKI